MKRKHLIEMTDEYAFRMILSKAKISDEAKVSIIKERQRYMSQNLISKNTKSIPKGPYRDPLTGAMRFNTER